MAKLNQELIRKMLETQGASPVADFDPTAASSGVAQGIDLANTIQTRKQRQEDRVKALAEEIEVAKRQKTLTSSIGGNDPALRAAAELSPETASKQLLEQKFTERAPKATATPNFVKIGETADEIIMADPSNPNHTVRVKAPGVGARSKGGVGDEKAKLGLDIEKERAKVIIDKTKQALEQVGPFTVGAGSLLKNIPATGAKNLASTIDTIKANLGFEQLAKMRAASPTGGALGQIAVKELEFLQAAVSNLDTAQGQAQVTENLKEVQTRYENWLKAVEQAEQSPESGTPVPAAGTSGLSPEQRRARIAELKAKQAQGTLGR